MMPPLLDKSHPSPADKWLWALLGVLVAGQIVAIWMLCQQQVDKAQVRDAAVRTEHLAMQDVCAPRNGRATCLPTDQQGRTGTEMNGVMAALR